MIQNDPASVVMAITEALKEQGMSLDDLLGGEQEQEQQTPVGLPQDVLDKLSRVDQMETMLSNMYEQFTSSQQNQNEERLIQQVDNLIADMHSTHGEFNDEFVLLQLEKGLEPEQAIQAWQKEIEKYGSPQRRPAPTLLSSNGAVKQQDQVDVSKLSAGDRKAYVASIMAANLDN